MMSDHDSIPPEILFFSEDVTFSIDNEHLLIPWIQACIEKENKVYQQIHFIFCSDDYLLELNKKHLNHDYFTDVITFCLQNDPIEADICISVDRVRENAKKLNTSFFQELHRVIIHGVLHCIGYDDKTPKLKSLMREKEDSCLALLAKG